MFEVIKIIQECWRVHEIKIMYLASDYLPSNPLSHDKNNQISFV